LRGYGGPSRASHFLQNSLRNGATHFVLWVTNTAVEMLLFSKVLFLCGVILKPTINQSISMGQKSKAKSSIASHKNAASSILSACANVVQAMIQLENPSFRVHYDDNYYN